MTVTEEFRAARDRLLALREDYDGRPQRVPVAALRGVQLGPGLVRPARGGPGQADKPALGIVEEDGSATRRSFAELSRRSAQVANWLRAQGVAARRPRDRDARQPGRAVGTDARRHEARRRHHPDHDPAGPRRPARPGRPRRRGLGRRRHVADTGKFDEVPGDYTRIGSAAARGPAAAGALAAVRGRAAAGVDFTPGRAHPADDTLLLYFTSGTTSSRSWSSTPTRPTRSGTCRRCTGSACSPATCTSTSPRRAGPSTPGATCSRPWNAEATVLHLQLRALRRRARCWSRSGARGSPPSARRRRCGGCSSRPTSAPARPACARWSAPASRSTPRSSSRCARAWGLTIRDGFGQTETTAQVGNTPGQPCKPGSMGRPLPGYPVVLVDPLPGERRPTRARSACAWPPGRVGLMTGYRDDAERRRPRRCATATTTPATSPAGTPTATSPTSAAPTTSSRPPTTGSPRSSWRAC